MECIDAIQMFGLRKTSLWCILLKELGRDLTHHHANSSFKAKHLWGSGGIAVGEFAHELIVWSWHRDLFEEDALTHATTVQ